jgi:hypothetical protein
MIVNATCVLLTAEWQLLHIHEQISLQDVLAFFVLLCRLICLVLSQLISMRVQIDDTITHVFPTKSSTAFAAIDIPDGVITRGHWTIVGLTLNDVDTASSQTKRICRDDHLVTHTTSKR